ncbi:MAG: hypothetical protein JRE12_16810, partial [Deltaproteobacteria bacterium]|nr:hypothetical protein [Deltaproteobacteria bacterium]
MRKFIISVFIAGFIAGSANAEMLEFHFTANINSYVDGSGIFSELGYSDSMAVEGTFTIETETESDINFLEPDEFSAIRLWRTGTVMFNNQGYAWVEAPSSTLAVFNDPSTLFHQTDIRTGQDNLTDFPGVKMVAQKITLNNDGLDASMPTDFNLGISSEFIVEIEKTGEPVSIFWASITSIMNAEEYAASQAEPTIEE